MNNTIKELKQLNIEDFICVVFIITSIINLYGDDLQRKYVLTNQYQYKEKSTDVFTFTLIVTFIIYIYFFIRNYNNYKNCYPKEKRLYQIKLLGSALLIIGAICLIYFQTSNKTNTSAQNI